MKTEIKHYVDVSSQNAFHGIDVIGRFGVAAEKGRLPKSIEAMIVIDDGGDPDDPALLPGFYNQTGQLFSDDCLGLDASSPYRTFNKTGDGVYEYHPGSGAGVDLRLSFQQGTKGMIFEALGQNGRVLDRRVVSFAEAQPVR